MSDSKNSKDVMHHHCLEEGGSHRIRNHVGSSGKCDFQLAGIREVGIPEITRIGFS